MNQSADLGQPITRLAELRTKEAATLLIDTSEYIIPAGSAPVDLLGDASDWLEQGIAIGFSALCELERTNSGAQCLMLRGALKLFEMARASLDASVQAMDPRAI